MLYCKTFQFEKDMIIADLEQKILINCKPLCKFDLVRQRSPAGTPESGCMKEALSPCLCIGGGGATGVEAPFHKSVIGNLMLYHDRMEQIYCSFSCTYKLQYVFFIISGIFVRSPSLLNRNKRHWYRFFCFL